ncbi:MAG: hypothetical protein DI603_14965 [Roseateles depolymerans]|uniref:Uncharacterized protein n=1 Tax=Roseateles depolymerans TaxID=76731 RepID=A0A2W5DIJ8_9BURK|nr:MAG: hypothetical protein DI603_14965 [Roseateles depolymerans]
MAAVELAGVDLAAVELVDVGLAAAELASVDQAAVDQVQGAGGAAIHTQITRARCKPHEYRAGRGFNSPRLHHSRVRQGPQKTEGAR